MSTAPEWGLLAALVTMPALLGELGGHDTALWTEEFVAALTQTCGEPDGEGEGANGDRGDVELLRDLRYREGASKQWRLDLARKKQAPAKPRPAIVVIHGGGWLEGDKSSFASDKDAVPGNIVDFANLGFVAVTINYRLSTEAMFPAALDDCKCAVCWLRAHAKEYGVDPDRIGAYGNSAGGHLALLLGLAGEEAARADNPFPEHSSRVQAVVSDSGPVDLIYQYQHEQLKEVIRRFMGGPLGDLRTVLYRKASPAYQIRPGAPPLLLIYGVEDEQVPVETADQFVVASTRAGLKDVSYYRLASVGHCPHSLVRVPTLRTVVKDFFIRTLLPEGKVPRASGSR